MIHFLIPAYNEEKNIEKLLFNIDTLFAPKYNVTVVDDGSTDKTYQTLTKLKSKLPLTILQHKKNLGLGCALKTGFSYLFNNIKNGDIIITMDADNSHPPETVKEMLKFIKHYEIVIASRYRNSSSEIGVSTLRKITGKMINTLLSLLFPAANLKDYTSGFRAIKGEFLKRVYTEDFITQKGFVATTEFLLKSLFLFPKIYEIPFVLRYDLKIGKSKMNVLKTIFQYIIFITKFKISKLFR